MVQYSSITPLAIVTLSVACIASCTASEDQFPEDLAKWIATDPPLANSDRLSAANYSRNEWVVFVREGRPSVRALKRNEDDRGTLPFPIKQGSAKEGLAGQVYAIKVTDGWIVGFNAGEFGAGLWWFSPDGKSRYKISNDQVCGFLETDQGLLALEGLAHLSISRGQIIRLARDAESKWKSEAFVDLKDAPRAAIREKDGSLLVATTERLVRVGPDKDVNVLLDKMFWWALYPNSAVVDDSGAIYLGMRHGVAKISKDGKKYKVSWLLPNQEAVNAKRET